MKIVSFKIWTQIAMSISYNHNCYIMSASITWWLSVWGQSSTKLTFSWTYIVSVVWLIVAGGVMVIVTGYGYGDPSSIPGQD